MSPENILYFSLLALLAEIFGTVGGFGSSLFFVPIAGFFLDFHSVLGITAAFHILSNITKISFFRKGVDKKLLLTIGVPSVCFVILGALLTNKLNNIVLEILLSVFLIGLSLFFLIFKNLVVKPNTRNSLIGGSLSGFTAGLLGSGGAIRGLTMAAYGLEKEIFIATSAAIDLGVDLSRGVVYFSNGFIHEHDLYLLPILLIASIIGTFTGKKILTRFSETQFRTFVLLLILATGITSIIRHMW